MRTYHKSLGRFIKTVCIFAVLLVVLSTVCPCFASVVQVPVFTEVPEKGTFIAGSNGSVQTSAKIYGDSSAEIKYTLEVLSGTRFYPASGDFTENSSKAVNIEFAVGKGNIYLLNSGTYTARIRAASLDGIGNEMAVAYCPVFEIEVLPPVIKTVVADYKICYGGEYNEFYISAELSSLYGEDEIKSVSWQVSDGILRHTLSEGEKINGMTFYGTKEPFLILQGTPERILELSFTVSVSVEGADTPQVSKEVEVEFRPYITPGFSLGDDGMRFFRVDGRFVTGWLRNNGALYYFDPESGIMATGLKAINGKKCLFGEDGRLMMGFCKTPLGYRYFENGSFVTGWLTVDGTDYYFEPYTGYMTARKDVATGEIFYFEEYGSRSTASSDKN